MISDDSFGVSTDFVVAIPAEDDSVKKVFKN